MRSLLLSAVLAIASLGLTVAAPQRPTRPSTGFPTGVSCSSASGARCGRLADVRHSQGDRG